MQSFQKDDANRSTAQCFYTTIADFELDPAKLLNLDTSADISKCIVNDQGEHMGAHWTNAVYKIVSEAPTPEAEQALTKGDACTASLDIPEETGQYRL